MDNNYILIGKLTSIHGIKGEMKMYPYTDDLENLSKTKFLYFDKELTNKHIIQNCRIHKNMFIIKFKDIDSPEVASKFKDKDVYISRDSLKKLEDNTYYISDLIGMEVLDENENYIGKLEYVQNIGANDVYEIVTKDNKKIYLPAIHDVIKKVDIVNKKMYVEIMKGLI